jgi:APA family basic amino acid/polyamine antiporter
VTKVLALAALAGLLLAFGDPALGALAEPLRWQPASWGGFWVALIAVLWTYTGWVDLSYLAGEVRNPSRSYPRAMAGGLAVVVLLYLLVNAAFHYVLSLPEIAGSSVVASAAADRVFGATGGSLVAALVMVSAFGSLNGTILSNPRVFFSMAEDGLFFRSVASVHPRYRTPHLALLLYLVLGLLGVTTQTFEQLAEIFVLGIWPFYALAVGAVIVLRRRRPAVRPAYRTWGYPAVPVVFLLISVAMLVNGAVQRPLQTALSFGVLALGVPAYYGWLAITARRIRRGNAAP